MPLSAADEAAILAAGTTSDQAVRGCAVAIVLGTQADDRQAARRMLAQGYLEATQPSFQLIPRGDAMLPSDRFEAAYAALARGTGGFRDIRGETISEVLLSHPAALAPLRMITGLTLKELAVAVRLASGTVVSDASLRTWEREAVAPEAGTARARRRVPLAAAVADAVVAAIERRILAVPAPPPSRFTPSSTSPIQLRAGHRFRARLPTAFRTQSCSTSGTSAACGGKCRMPIRK